MVEKVVCSYRSVTATVNLRNVSSAGQKTSKISNVGGERKN